MIAVAAGRVILGIDDNPTKHFVWDNEGPKGSPVSVDSFKVAPSPCTIQEFHEFVFGRSGYATPKWWDPVDLQILQKRDQIMPATWSLAEAGDSGELSNIISWHGIGHVLTKCVQGFTPAVSCVRRLAE